MDKLFVNYYGRAVGIDAIAALENQVGDLSSDALACEEKEPDIRGQPIVPSNLLAEVYKNRGMRQIAGSGQHDSQEFFNHFVDALATEILSYQKNAQEMRQILHETQIKHSYPDKSLGTKSDKLDIRKMFMGTLRSVLICDKCGCKRTQSELFSNVSLPLAKEISTTDAEARRHLTVESVLDHFTSPETLADPVYCSSCSAKTKTLKQHTFSNIPNVLCLHLKRFHSAANKKITDFVGFPAHGLDMGKYLPHW
jgi:ubiquitin C-terminal hydrolase